MSLSRRGVSLAELLLAVALCGALAGLTARILLSATLQLRDRSERMGSEHALRVAAAALRNALEASGQDSSTGVDLAATLPTGFSVRVIRAAGTVCAASPGLLVARDSGAWWSAVRDPVAGRDSVLVASQPDTGWRVLALRAQPAPLRCPDGGKGIGLPVQGDPVALASAAPGNPLRVVEQVEFRLYTAAPDAWLGMRLLASTQPIQPFAGPMLRNGLRLDYERGDGQPALLPSEIAAVRIRLGVLTERPGGVGLIRGAAARADSAAVYVALPNRMK